MHMLIYFWHTNMYLLYHQPKVSCERSFSFLKNIKSRLRSQLSDPKLEAFMLMAIKIQKLTLLDSDKIIKELQKESSLLKKNLSL